MLCLHNSACYSHCGKNTSLISDHFPKCQLLSPLHTHRETVEQDADKDKQDFVNVGPMCYFDFGRVQGNLDLTLFLLDLKFVNLACEEGKASAT